LLLLSLEVKFFGEIAEGIVHFSICFSLKAWSHVK
jgi:hypothetical protein